MEIIFTVQGNVFRIWLHGSFKNHLGSLLLLSKTCGFKEDQRNDSSGQSPHKRFGIWGVHITRPVKRIVILVKENCPAQKIITDEHAKIQGRK